MRQKLIAGNWKMNGTREMAKNLCGALESQNAVEVVICPPATLIRECFGFSPSSVKVGGQDCHESSEGAFTGSISAGMLRDAGAEYVILGHSERRAQFGESDTLIMKKLEASHKEGLKVILCVGETLEEREEGQTLNVVSRQLSMLPPCVNSENTVIAYEPVWAIGTGKVASLEQIAEVHAAIRSQVGEKTRILYGGSVKADNAVEILSLVDVDGALVGGASLKADSFNAIIKAATQVSLQAKAA